MATDEYRVRLVEPGGKRPRPWPNVTLNTAFKDDELRAWLVSLAADHTNYTQPGRWMRDYRVEVLHRKHDEVIYTYHGREP